MSIVTTEKPDDELRLKLFFLGDKALLELLRGEIVLDLDWAGEDAKIARVFRLHDRIGFAIVLSSPKFDPIDPAQRIPEHMQVAHTRTVSKKKTVVEGRAYHES
jgi:hypothetical protein